MAARFWVGGAGTWDGSSTTHWSASSGGASGASAPTTSDDATFDSASGLGTGVTVTIAATATCNNLTITGPAGVLQVFSLSGNFTMVGALTCNGNSGAKRILFQSDTPGTARTFAIGSLSSLTNTDFMDITASGGTPWTGTLIGDCGGNTNITFTTPSTVTFIGAANANWSWSDATKWDVRVPLPQDDVVISTAFSGSRTITWDVNRLGKSITFAGSSIGTSLGISLSNNVMILGSLTMLTGMTMSVGSTITFAGRSTYTITSAGVAMTSITVQAVGGTYTQQDAFAHNAVTRAFSITDGTWVMNDFTMSLGTFSLAGSTRTRGISISATISLTGTGTVWNANAAGATVSYASERNIIDITDTSSTSKTFAGGGYTYPTLRHIATGTAGLAINQSNTFAYLTLACSSARTITLGTNRTTTVTKFFYAVGTGATMSFTGSTSTLALTDSFVGAIGTELGEFSASTGGFFRSGTSFDANVVISYIDVVDVKDITVWGLTAWH